MKLSSIADNTSKIRAAMTTKTDFNMFTKMLERSSNSHELNKQLESELMQIVTGRFSHNIEAAEASINKHDKIEITIDDNDGDET